MMQEDSNGESTFEFVDKKSDDMSTSVDTTQKTDSASSLTSSSISIVPSTTSLSTGGSLLTNVPPPSALPSFVTSDSNTRPATSTQPPTTVPGSDTTNTQAVKVPSLAFHQTTFSPVIPASKGGPPAPAAAAAATPVEPLSGEAGEGAGLMGWVRGVTGTSTGLLSRMAEKARSSVDSMITTLDPQMREFLHSGGDIHIVVASDKEVKVSPVREAFQAVFGKATVMGLAAQASRVAAQPVGFEAAGAAARERVASCRATHGLPPRHPVLAVENFLLQVGPDKWFDVGLLLLSDPSQGLELSVFTQGTPVPMPIVALAREGTPADYPLKDTGLALTVGSLMGQNLQVPHSQWHEALTGVPRRDMLLSAARALAGMYKSSNRTIL